MGFDSTDQLAVEGSTCLDCDTLSWFHRLDKVTLVDIVAFRRALALPCFEQYDLHDTLTWSMPLGANEYLYNSERRRWESVEYDLEPDEICYENGMGTLGAEMDTKEECNANMSEVLRRVRPRTEHEAGPSHRAGPSQPFTEQQTQPNPHWYNQQPYYNAFDPTYVHPSITNLGTQLQTYANNTNEQLNQLNRRLDEGEALNVQRHNELCEQMARLSTSQSNLLNPMFVHQLGWAPPHYNYQQPVYAPPQDYTWETRIQWPGPDWRPPNNQ